MSTPWGEHEHVEQAIERLYAADVEPPESEEQRAEREAYAAVQADWSRRLARLYHTDPDLWAALEARTLPKPGGGDMVMRPPVEMDFATLAAYQMGQSSIVRLFRITAEMEARANE